MSIQVKSFQEINQDSFTEAGGKAGNLARMFQMGLPVPEGFVVLSGAFREERLKPEVWEEIKARLNSLRRKFPGTSFAVRSSALSEDSMEASFAGQYETVLNTASDEEIFDALHAVYRSRLADRVRAYASARGIAASPEMSVVVQRMIPSEIAGVLFTADPVTGSHARIIGNYVNGPGGQLVSGEANAGHFHFTVPGGKYFGPKKFRRYFRTLFDYAKKIQAEGNCPQDIEWAVSRGTIYLLQARPISSLKTEDPEIYEMNHSLDGDFLWTNSNLSEAVPDVISPLNWSCFKYVDEFTGFFPKGYPSIGNICGRLYLNYSLLSSLFALFGMSPAAFSRKLREVFGKIPRGISIPVYPLLTLSVFFRQVLPGLYRRNRLMRDAAKRQDDFLAGNAAWCAEILESIANAGTPEELLRIWKSGIDDRVVLSHLVSLAAGNKAAFMVRLRKKLAGITRSGDYLDLLYLEHTDSKLASLGPVLGISGIIEGSLDEKEYMEKYGHRGPHEAELLLPSIGEDPDWLARQIDDFKKTNSDVRGLFHEKKERIREIRARFEKNFPRKVRWLDRSIRQASAYNRLREEARTEHIRSYRVIRHVALKAGKLTGIGDDVFFLYRGELIQLLEGDRSMLKFLPARKKNYHRYLSYPPFPSIIRGRFDPENWMKDPERRNDYHDTTAPRAKPDCAMLQGFAGASGRIRGVVRVLGSPEEGDELRPGEILVASTANIGWTPLFPRAAAIITDIGAPFSHAAIVARELGIPAVVGCGNATSVLRSGNLVVVDGGRGTVQVEPCPFQEQE